MRQSTLRGNPEVSVKANEYIEPPCCIEFTLRILNDGVITDATLASIMEYGGLHGYGAERGRGYGRYCAEITNEEED